MRSSDWPTSVELREVGPRDGFQNEPESIPTSDKVKLIGMLVGAGFTRLEVGSFVRPDVIPQLADTEDVLDAIDRSRDVRYSVLVPNRRGMERALRMRDRFDEISVFLSASETHNRHNVNRSIRESIDGLVPVVKEALEVGLGTVAVIATAFGCPYEGPVDPERVLRIAEELAEAGCGEIGFGDTTGMANPLQVDDFFRLARGTLPGVKLTAHFHNTRGQGLANVLAALSAGIVSFESSFGELGGCPVPVGATGNIASEDLVSMLHEMGIETRVDLPKLIEASRAVQAVLGRPLGSHVLRSGPVEWEPDRDEFRQSAVEVPKS